MNQRVLAVLVGAAALVSACGGGGGGDPIVVVPPVTEAVPAAAATSPAAATQYVTELTAVPPAQTDSLEPVAALPDSLATDDTAEPKAVE